jgi:hypothetical protein
MNIQAEQFVYQAVLSGELEVDEQGRIWRVKKRLADRWNGGTKTIPCKRVRAEMPNGSGYLQIRLMRNRKRVYAAAHRLVWIHFNGPIPDGLTVNHKFGIKDDNRPSELELATQSEQRHHAIKVLGAKHWDVKGSRHPKTKLTETDVAKIRELRRLGWQVKDIADTYGMKSRAISAICCRRTWTHVP